MTKAKFEYNRADMDAYGKQKYEQGKKDAYKKAWEDGAFTGENRGRKQTLEEVLKMLTQSDRPYGELKSELEQKIKEIER